MLGLVADEWRWAAVDPRQEATYGMVLGRLAHHCLMDGRRTDAAEWAGRALRLGREAGTRPAIVHAFYVRESLRAGGPPSGPQAVARTSAWLEGIPDSGERAWLLQLLASALVSVGEERAALETAERAVESAARAGNPVVGQFEQAWHGLSDRGRTLKDSVRPLSRSGDA